jgi:hypothetical protein
MQRSYWKAWTSPRRETPHRGEKQNLIKDLKIRILGLSVLEKSRARQKSRLTWLRLEDANTKYFHLMANARKRKNFIHSLNTDNGMALAHQEKQLAIYNHYLKHTRTYTPRSCLLNFAELGWKQNQLSHLELPFSESEVHTVIKEALKDKAPRPDGFIGSFFCECWELIKEDCYSLVLPYEPTRVASFKPSLCGSHPKKGTPSLSKWL